MVADFQGEGLSVLGLAEFNKRMLNFIRVVPEEMERAMVQEASDILKVAKSRTPVDTGALVDSGMIQNITPQGHHEATMAISFGSFGQSSGYAIYVHENLSAKHPNGGQAKFLESAVLEASDGMTSRIAARIKLERIWG